ncbi:2OG-Fe(II) oxygenase [Ephemerocybe angulata]|uniref:2OG-Fe(II) oxygenase n=1 Tax=Ephemerocybe angulata TaxID=980116 RepID=A0A8H6M5U0_9AGAR|nr:2OG-Fe(II) oxygenase [Tulosesus angulatus]
MSLIDEAASVDAFKDVPVIDLSHIFSDDPSFRKGLVSQIRDACIRVGFFYGNLSNLTVSNVVRHGLTELWRSLVSNHGIPEEVIAYVLAGAKQFFALPLETKMEIENKKQPNFKGYSPLLSGNNDPYGAGDLQEGFEFGWEALDDQKGVQDESISGAMTGANVWPSEAAVTGFRNAALTYYHAATKLGKALFPLFAEALDQRPDFFHDKTQHSAALMKFLYYPPQLGPVDDRVIGIGAHTDWECFTILWQEPGIQALQVLNSEKQWIDAPPMSGTLVINLGDEFARITNGIFKSTVHRAINRNGVERYSIPLFFGVDYNTKLEPMPSCVSTDRPFEHEVITAGEYIKSRLAATYNHK